MSTRRSGPAPGRKARPVEIMKNTRRLQNALLPRFAPAEATGLAKLLMAALSANTLSYEQVDLPPAQKNDCILAAFEERMLLPLKCGRSSAWEDRILALCVGEKYFLPPVVRRLVKNAQQTAKLEPVRAVRQCLAPKAGEHAAGLVRFFQTIRYHAPACRIEVGLMSAIGRQLAIVPDLHDVIDLFVVGGIISPCIRGPMSSGLVWYEINPCLY